MMTRIVLESKENMFFVHRVVLAMQMHEIITWLDLDFSQHLDDDLKLIESEQSIRGNLSSLIFLVPSC